jgi:hypothetical protein
LHNTSLPDSKKAARNAKAIQVMSLALSA